MVIGYKTTNLINGKFYYGIHKCNRIDDGYIGCGIMRQSDARYNMHLHEAVRKYGYNNFKRETIKEFKTYEDACQYADDESENALDVKFYVFISLGKWTVSDEPEKEDIENSVTVFMNGMEPE